MRTYHGVPVTNELLQKMVARRIENLNAKRSRWDQLRPVGRELRQFTFELIEECIKVGFFVKGTR